jgi:hypothetical protein
MGGKKILLLFLGLGLPVLIFVFLKFFGRNEFEVPLLYDKKVTGTLPDCDVEYKVPYFLDDSLMRQISATPARLLLVNFSASSPKLQQLATSFTPDLVLRSQKDLNINSERINFVKNCLLLVKPPATLVLIDEQKRIRGYYDGSDRDELDRLQAEINIILKKY